MLDMSTMSLRERAQHMPTLYFPSHWGVMVLPPWGGATVRMYIKSGDKTVSVYLDCDDNLGYMGEPYWEVYDGYNETRCCLAEGAEALLDLIGKALETDTKGIH